MLSIPSSTPCSLCTLAYFYSPPPETIPKRLRTLTVASNRTTSLLPNFRAQLGVLARVLAPFHWLLVTSVVIQSG